MTQVRYDESLNEIFPISGVWPPIPCGIADAHCGLPDYETDGRRPVDRGPADQDDEVLALLRRQSSRNSQQDELGLQHSGTWCWPDGGEVSRAVR